MDIRIDHGIDALLPAEIAAKAEAIGAQKVRLDSATLLVLAVLGGAFIAFGALFATTVLAGAGALPFGVSRLPSGVVFSLGLVLIVVGGAELFTGNALMVMALAARRIRLVEMLRAWAIVFVGNLVGAVGTAILVLLSGQYLMGKGAVAAVALRIASDKVALSFDRALVLAILCNVLVCLAVWLALGARTTTDKVLAVLMPISAFVAAGFEHSVADMYFIPLGLLIKAFGSDRAVGADRGRFCRPSGAHVEGISLCHGACQRWKRHWWRSAGRRRILVHLSASAATDTRVRPATARWSSDRAA